MDSLNIVPGRYVVLGASGLIGHHVLMLLKNQPKVTVLAVSGHRDLTVSADNITHKKVDLLDAADCDAVIAGADYVICTAGIVASAPVLAKDPIGPIQKNLKIATNCLESAWQAQAKHTVWISSTTAYPELDGKLLEEALFTGQPPEQWYGLGWMTRYVEKFAQYLSDKVPDPIAITALRPSLVYGENDHFDESAHFLPAMIKRVVNREQPIEIWGDGKQSRDVIHGQDVAVACLQSMNRVSGFAAYNIAESNSYSVNEILRLICEIDGYQDVQFHYRKDKPQTIKSREFSIALAQSELGFHQTVNLTDGLLRTINWYRENKMPQQVSKGDNVCL